jgi:protein SCO1/2
VGAVVAARAAGGGSSAEPAAAGLGGVVHAPYDVPEVVLTDTAGEPYSLTEDTDADLTLVFFGYTHCPDICPTTMATVAAAVDRLDPADRERVEVVFVTSDPARDTAPVLRGYLDRFDPSFTGLTGDLDDIIAAGEPLAVYVSDGQELPSGGYDLGTHSSQLTAITPDETSPILWTQDVSTAELAADIQRLLGPDADRLLEEGLT